MTFPTIPEQLHHLGMYRIETCFTFVEQRDHPAITAPLVLAVFSRESLMQNIIGGKPVDSDTGIGQINRVVFARDLKKMAGCPSGSWIPDGKHTAAMLGYCPTFHDSCIHTIDLLVSNYRQAIIAGVTSAPMRLRVAVAGYNRGAHGALTALEQHGDPDVGTAHNNYSADTLGTRFPQINTWCQQHHLVD